MRTISLPNLFTRALQLFGMTAKSHETAQFPESLSVEAIIENALYGSVHVTPSAALGYYRQSSAIGTAVDLIASKIEAINPVIERGGEIQDRDEVTDFLAKPNDFSMWRSFIGAAARYYLLTGNSYFFGLGTLSRPPLEVYSVTPVDIHPFGAADDGFPDSYNFGGMLAPGRYLREPAPGGGIRFVDGPLRQVYHTRGFSSRHNKLVGDSPIESILLEIRQHIAGRQHNEAMLRNGGRLSLLFIVKEMLGKTEFREMADRLREQFGGAHNAGKVATVSGKDLEAKEMGVTNKDMDFVNLDEVTKSAIFSRYNIPLPLITSSRQSFNNYETAVEALYDDAVLPLIEILLEGLSDFLLPRFGRDPRTERITYDPQSIGALRRRMLVELEKAAGLNILTMNEQRAKLPNIGPIDGGDAVFGSATMVPIAGDGIDLAAEHQDDRDAAEEARDRLDEQAAAGDTEGSESVADDEPRP